MTKEFCPEPREPPPEAYPPCAVCGTQRQEMTFNEQGVGVCLLCTQARSNEAVWRLIASMNNKKETNASILR